MCCVKLIFILVLVKIICGEVPPQATEQEIIQKHENKIRDYIVKILDHYKQTDPVGIPGAPVPDPLNIPDLSKRYSVGKMDFFNAKLHGLSKFRVQHIKADITAMKVETALLISNLTVKGNYTLKTWVSTANGPFTVKLSDVYVRAIAALEVERGGHLEAQDMNMDITFKNIDMEFQGLGFFASVFQGIINSVGNFIFESVKPLILKEVNTNLRNDVNKEVKKLPQKFPNSISPFDQLIADVRNRIRNAKLDPYQVANFNNTVGIFDVKLSHTWLFGLSSIHRSGDIIFEIKNNTVHALLEAGTQRLKGISNWEISLVAGIAGRSGTVSFTVEYLSVQVSLSQSMDTRKRPQIDDIQLELGNIQIRFDGAGTVDYLIEAGVNILPNLLRYQIMDALETPIQQRIQAEFNKINVEEVIIENIDKIENPGSIDLF